MSSEFCEKTTRYGEIFLCKAQDTGRDGVGQRRPLLYTQGRLSTDGQRYFISSVSRAGNEQAPTSVTLAGAFLCLYYLPEIQERSSWRSAEAEPLRRTPFPPSVLEAELFFGFGCCFWTSGTVCRTAAALDLICAFVCDHDLPVLVTADRVR